MTRTLRLLLLPSLTLALVAGCSGSSDPGDAGSNNPQSEGWFVATTGSDSAAGTRQAPFATIARGIAAASALGGGDVHVAAGTYPGTLELANDVAVYGGYDAAWARNPSVNVTVVQGGSGDLYGNDGVFGPGVTNVILDGLTIRSAAATLLGRSSYGVRLDSSSNVQLHALVIEAGDGAPGLPGGTPPGGQVGQPGENGTAACTENTCTGVGGAGGTLGSMGGAGGMGGYATDGTAGQRGLGTGGGAGGAGGILYGTATTIAGKNGSPGASGAAGANAPGGASLGVVSDARYAGHIGSAVGGIGGPGSFGAGGGGGGGGGGAMVWSNALGDFVDHTGAGGGGGGSGGSPGNGGGGGD
uniref:DUF1565 domain-containing protein n=1 Tax=Anaeromyxobacter sp. SG66 TaxID=2925410 RepID=UPI002105FC59